MPDFDRSHFKPVLHETMMGAGPDFTICGVLREAYLKSSENEVRELLRLATAMAKRMSTKLVYYRRKEDAAG